MSLRAFVLAVEKLFQLFLQISRSAVLFRGFERIHGWPVVFPEFIHERRRRAGKVEGKRVARERDLLCRNPAAANRSITLLSMPHVIGLTKPSGGGGV